MSKKPIDDNKQPSAMFDKRWPAFAGDIELIFKREQSMSRLKYMELYE